MTIIIFLIVLVLAVEALHLLRNHGSAEERRLAKVRRAEQHQKEVRAFGWGAILGALWFLRRNG